MEATLFSSKSKMRPQMLNLKESLQQTFSADQTQPSITNYKSSLSSPDQDVSLFDKWDSSILMIQIPQSPIFNGREVNLQDLDTPLALKAGQFEDEEFSLPKQKAVLNP